MIIYILIVAFFIFFAGVSFRKSFLSYCAFSILFNASMAVKYSPPSISIDLLLSTFYFVVFLNKRKSILKKRDHCFFKNSFILSGVILFVSSYLNFNLQGSSGLTYSIRVILTLYIDIYMFWYLCNTRSAIRYFLNNLFFVFVLVVLYGIYEYITGTNPILEYQKSIVPEIYSQGKLYLSDLNALRGGRARYQSLFNLTIIYGVATILYLFFLLELKKYKQYLPPKKYYYLLIILCAICCFWSNSKTPLMVVPVLLIPIVKGHKKLIVILIVVMLIILLDPSFFLNILNSIINLSTFDTNDQDLSNGSTLYMRMVQFKISFDSFMQSPILGHGLRYSEILSLSEPELMGAESIWFKLLIEQGLLGIISYLYLNWVFLKESLCHCKSKYFLICLTISSFVINSITDISQFSLFYFLFIIIDKLDRLSQIESKKI